MTLLRSIFAWLIRRPPDQPERLPLLKTQVERDTQLVSRLALGVLLVRKQATEVERRGRLFPAPWSSFPLDRWTPSLDEQYKALVRREKALIDELNAFMASGPHELDLKNIPRQARHFLKLDAVSFNRPTHYDRLQTH